MICCPKCGEQTPRKEKRCAHCGARLRLSLPLEVPAPEGGAIPGKESSAATLVTRTCPRCDTVNMFMSRNCSRCGRDLADVPIVSERPVPGDTIAVLTRLLSHGRDGGRCSLQGPEAVIGCNSGEIFTLDPYLTPQHARFWRRDGQLFVEEVDHLCGILLRIEQEVLHSADVFRIGRELLRLDELPAGSSGGSWGRLSIIAGREEASYLLKGRAVLLGRNEGDVQFPRDRHVSRLHARITRDDEGVITLKDLGSRRGTYLRLRRPQPINFGAEVIIGQQHFRVDEPNDRPRAARTPPPAR